VEVAPVGANLDHAGDDRGRGALLGRDAGEVPEVLLGLLDDLRVVAVVDFLVTGDDNGRIELGDLVEVGDPLRQLGLAAAAVSRREERYGM
jgi:hypothetical protein